MKILLEQQQYIMNAIQKSQEKIEHLQEQCFFNWFGSSEEMRTLRESLAEENQRIIVLKGILNSSSVVTEFNNTQIDVGTLFKVKFSGEEELVEFTMVELNVEGNFGPLNGYITKDSPFGRSIYSKKASSSFSYSMEGNKNKVVGEIVEIIPKKSTVKKVKSTTFKGIESEKKIVASKKTRFDPNSTCSGFLEYYDKLLRYRDSSKVAKRELAQLESITSSQYQHLLECSNFLMDEIMKNGKKSRSNYQKLGHVGKILKREVLPVPSSFRVEFGTHLILEIDGLKETIVKEVELVPFCYRSLKDYHDEYLSFRRQMGFLSFRSQMGESFKVNDSRLKSFRIAQFNIHPEKLLLPTSSNLSFYNEQEMEAFYERVQYQKKKHVIMTLSQKTLLDSEISKVSENFKATPYIGRLQSLKHAVENQTILVQTDEMLEKNGERVGVGSTVCYAFLMDDELQEQQREIISCAFTVEESDQYIEEFSPLGKSLLGKSKDDYFSVEIDGKIQKGIVVSVSNQPLEKKQCYIK